MWVNQKEHKLHLSAVAEIGFLELRSKQTRKIDNEVQDLLQENSVQLL